MKTTRPQAIVLHNLLIEFQSLKTELFAGASFIAIEGIDQGKWDRYDQLLGFFYPEFRSPSWETPYKEIAA